jgi:hypothetical protein
MTAYEKVIMQKQFSRGIKYRIIEGPEHDPVICILMPCACTQVEDGVTNGFTALTVYSIQYNPTS